jgi:hypothetical protein
MRDGQDRGGKSVVSNTLADDAKGARELFLLLLEGRQRRGGVLG